MTASINQLPLEVLATILDHAKQPPVVSSFEQTKPDSTIFSCLLCCKKWHDIALPIIYHDVSLHNDNLASFTRCYSLVRLCHKGLAQTDHLHIF